MVIDTCVENLSCAVPKAMAASTHKSRPRDNRSPLVPAGIQGEVRMKNGVRRQYQITRDPALRAVVNHLQMSVNRRLNEWRNEQWSTTLEFLDPEDELLRMIIKRMMRIPTPCPSWSPRGVSLFHVQRKPKHFPTVLRLGFSRFPFLQSWQLLRWLTWC